MAEEIKVNALDAKGAYQLSDITKTVPQLSSLTPKWISKFLD